MFVEVELDTFVQCVSVLEITLPTSNFTGYISSMLNETPHSAVGSFVSNRYELQVYMGLKLSGTVLHFTPTPFVLIKLPPQPPCPCL